MDLKFEAWHKYAMLIGFFVPSEGLVGYEAACSRATGLAFWTNRTKSMAQNSGIATGKLGAVIFRHVHFLFPHCT